MATRGSASRRGGRDARSIASYPRDPLDQLLAPATWSPSPVLTGDAFEASAWSPLAEFEDRRLFSPSHAPVLDYAPPRYLGGSPARFRVGGRGVVPPGHFPALLSPVIGFRQPARLSLCIRRHRRRQVLAARGVLGGRVRKPTRSAWSSISCRR